MRRWNARCPGNAGNAAALLSSNTFMEKHGLPLASFRNFGGDSMS